MSRIEYLDGAHPLIVGASVVAMFAGVAAEDAVARVGAMVADASNVEAVASAASVSGASFSIAQCVGPVVIAALAGAGALRLVRRDGTVITVTAGAAPYVRFVETDCATVELSFVGDAVLAPAVLREAAVGAFTAGVVRYTADASVEGELVHTGSPAAVSPAEGTATEPVELTTEREVPVALLQFGDGTRVAVDRTVIIGRSPSVVRSTAETLPTLVPVVSPGNGVSRLHVKISIDGTHIVLEDLHSTNGTEIVATNGLRFRALPGEPALLSDGMVVSIGEQVDFRVVSP